MFHFHHLLHQLSTNHTINDQPKPTSQKHKELSVIAAHLTLCLQPSAKQLGFSLPAKTDAFLDLPLVGKGDIKKRQSQHLDCWDVVLLPFVTSQRAGGQICVFKQSGRSKGRIVKIK